MKRSLVPSRMALALTVLVLGSSLLSMPAMACTKDLVSYVDEDGDKIIEVGEKVYFNIVIRTKNYYAIDAERIRLKDRFAAELQIESWSLEGTYEELPEFRTKGRSEKVFLDWYIGTQQPGEYAIIRIKMSTDLNPAGHQEYTSPGRYELNSGAVVKKVYDGEQYSWETEPLYIDVFEQNND